MKNVLIIEDEGIARMGLKTSIDWEKEDLQLVGEASNGQEGLKFIKNNKVDIVLLDIKMPQMDGIEFLKELQGEYFLGQVIVLSSFDDYQLVRQAMKLGAYDYLHKPTMDSETIKQVIQEAATELDNKGINSQRFKGKDKTEVLKKIFTGEIEIPEQKLGPHFNIELSEKDFAVLILEVKDLDKLSQNYEGNQEKISIQNILEETLSNYGGAEFCGLTVDKYSIIYNFTEKEDDQQREQELKTVANEIKNIFLRFLNLNIVVGISKIYCQPNKIVKARREAEVALEKQFFLQHQAVVFYKNIVNEQNNSKEVNVSIDVQKIEKAIEGENSELVIEFIEQNFGQFEKQTPEKEAVYHFVYDLLYVFKKIFKQEDLHKIDSEVSDFIDRIHKFRSLNELKDNLVKFIIDIMNEKQKMQTQKYGAVVKKIINYIKNNYEQDINLSLISEVVNMNSSYISRLFKEKTDKTLIDYLTEVRINKAKDLLQTTDLKVYQVANQVGYKNSHYFSKVFKQQVGKSPTEYRSKH